MGLDRKYVAPSRDGAVKLAWETEDHHVIESVYLPHPDKRCVCVSTQVGCKMGCRFCATSGTAFVRNLSSDEIIGQVLGTMAHVSPGGQVIRPDRVLLMGVGEPLDNYRQLVDCLRYLARSRFFARTTAFVATCGIVPSIYSLAGDAPFVELWISLHASNDEVRGFVIPVNRTYAIRQVLDAAEHFAVASEIAVRVNYMVLAGINNLPAHAAELAELVRDRPFRLQVAHYNPVPNAPFTECAVAEDLEFCVRVERQGVEVEYFGSKGIQVEGACGQLRSRLVAGLGWGGVPLQLSEEV